MKYFLPLIVSMLILASCGSQSESTASRDVQLIVDSLVYKNNNVTTDTLQYQPEEEKPVAQKTVAKKASPKTNTVKAQPVKRPVYREEVVTTPPPVSSDQGSVGSGDMEAGTTTGDAGIPGATQTAKKKGMSKAAQGAVIGGASGAVAGAIISKKKGLGAVVGGVVGAAGGYIIGKNKEKKEMKTNNP